MEPFGRGFEAHVGISLSLGTPQVRRQDNTGAMFERVLNGGQRCLNALIAGDLHLALFVFFERHIEVYPDENSFAAEIKIAYGEIGHRRPQMDKPEGNTGRQPLRTADSWVRPADCRMLFSGTGVAKRRVDDDFDVCHVHPAIGIEIVDRGPGADGFGDHHLHIDNVHR